MKDHVKCKCPAIVIAGALIIVGTAVMFVVNCCTRKHKCCLHSCRKAEKPENDSMDYFGMESHSPEVKDSEN